LFSRFTPPLRSRTRNANGDGRSNIIVSVWFWGTSGWRQWTFGSHLCM